VPVDGVEAGEEVGEIVRAERNGQRRADGGVDGIAPADPVPEAEGVGRVDPEGRHLVEGCRHRNEMLADRVRVHALGAVDGAGVAELAQQPFAGHPRVGEGLERREGLGGDDEQRGGRVQVCGLLEHVRRVDVGDEAALESVLHVRLERLVDHDRAEVGAADADVHDGLDLGAGNALPLPAAHAVREVVDLVEHLVHLHDDVGAVDDEAVRARSAQGRVEHRAVLRDVDLLPGVHGIPAFFEADLLAELDQCGDHRVVDEVLGEVDMEVGSGEAEPLRASRIGGEPAAQVGLQVGGQLGQLLPRGSGGRVHGCAHDPRLTSPGSPAELDQETLVTRATLAAKAACGPPGGSPST